MRIRLKALAMAAFLGTRAERCDEVTHHQERKLGREVNAVVHTLIQVACVCTKIKTQHKGLSGNGRYALLILSSAIICFNTAINAGTGHEAKATTADRSEFTAAASTFEQLLAEHLTLKSLSLNAEEAADRGDFAAAALAYEQLLIKKPTSISLRLDFASALKNDRQWERAISEYQTVIKHQPNNTEAALGIGTVRRWQGNIDEALRTYEQMLKLEPQNTEGLLGLADTYVLDHDYVEANKLYEQAQQMWPGDSGVQQAAYDFHRRRNPRLYLFWENDLSFQLRQVGFIVPFAAREEIGAEHQKETSIAPQLDNAKIYSHSDNKIFYTHYFGLNHMLDFSARVTEYTYNVPDTDLGYVAIDTYREYRARYTTPITPEQIFSLRYTLRPTILKLSQDNFTAHKLEAELNTHWLPRFSTLLGVGWLRDLDSNASNASELTNRSLITLGMHWDVTNHLGLGAKYITNPDLDNSITATSIAEASYSFRNNWSVIGRYRADDYRASSDQTSFYLAIRFVPNSNWWSEFGLKYAERGDSDGSFGLASVSYHF